MYTLLFLRKTLRFVNIQKLLRFNVNTESVLTYEVISDITSKHDL